MRFSHLVLGLVPLALAAVHSAAAQQAGGAAVYTVTYFEAAAPDVANAVALTRQFVAASRKEPGNAGFEAFQEIGRPSRFALFEGWHDKTAADAHDKGPAATAFHDKLQPLLVGPFEVRVFNGFSIAGQTAQGGPRAVYVVTHVDVFPGREGSGSRARYGVGRGRPQVAGQLTVRRAASGSAAPNHFTLVQGWRDRKAFDDSLMAASTRDFRQKLTPLEGALYDERLYYALRP